MRVEDLLESYIIPPVARVRQGFDETSLDNAESVLWDELQSVRDTIQPGMHIAITGSSRGIDKYQIIMKTIVDFVKARGAEPFIVPAMGSHGGATAEGQQKVLEDLGITNETVGCSIRSSMDVVEIGRTELDLPVYIDKLAFEADGIILLNRVKTHTSIRGEIQSGLVKMCAIGLAKHKGCAMTHSLGVRHLGENVERVGKVVLEKANILFGVATTENGFSHLANIYVVPRDEIFETEKKILQSAKKMVPEILMDNIDALIVYETGKDIAGTGMDPAVIGRPFNKKPNTGTEVEGLGVLRLTKTTAGNSCGIGMADFISQHVRDEMIENYMRINAITGMAPVLGAIPITLPTDKLVFKACIRNSGQIYSDKVKLVIIKNTKNLNEIYMSKAAFEASNAPERMTRLTDYFEVPFDENGMLKLFS